MFKILKTAFLFSLILLTFSQFKLANAQEQNLPEINFFYSQTCNHCANQKEFHKYLKEKYPDLVINSYDIGDAKTTPILKEFTKKYNAETYIGLVPLTFVGNSFIVGFNTKETTGASIELALIKNNSGLLEQAATCEDRDNALCAIDVTSELANNFVDSGSYTIINQTSRLSAFGIKAENLSLPVLSVVLGFLDGFNVCSLGALMLILSLVLMLKSRKKVLIFGSIFILVTGLTYASLIFIWFSLFELLSPFVSLLQTIIGVLGLFGGLIFLRQYFRFKKYGPACEISDSPIILKVTNKVKEVFLNQKNVWMIITAIVLFSFVVTIIEFPCSAVIPVAFAAILSDFGVGLGLKFVYLILFMIFYLLDEIIVFAMGVITLKIWVGGHNITTKLTLVQAILFLVIGVFYLWRLIV